MLKFVDLKENVTLIEGVVNPETLVDMEGSCDRDSQFEFIQKL